MKCQDIDSLTASETFDGCPNPATHILGRRAYCAIHAPEDSVELDSFVAASAMTPDDKAAEYDKMAEYLRKQGWSVVSEGKRPDNGKIKQTWRHAAMAGNVSHDMFSALEVEHFKDAPRQGERMAELLRGLNEAVEAKKKTALDTEFVLPLDADAILQNQMFQMGAALGTEMKAARDTRACTKCGAAIGKWCQDDGGESSRADDPQGAPMSVEYDLISDSAREGYKLGRGFWYEDAFAEALRSADPAGEVFAFLVESEHWEPEYAKRVSEEISAFASKHPDWRVVNDCGGWDGSVVSDERMK